jgi:hypothetical protein
MTPSATWGVSPLDLYHCHVVIDLASVDDDWRRIQKQNDLTDRADKLKIQAVQAGPRDGAAWTKALRGLLLAPGSVVKPAYFDTAASFLRVVLEAATAKNAPVKFVWHTLEHSRPAGMPDDDPRRSWISDVTPAAGAVTPTTFPYLTYGQHVLELSALAFVVDADAVVTVGSQTQEETFALVGLNLADVTAAEKGMP